MTDQDQAVEFYVGVLGFLLEYADPDEANLVAAKFPPPGTARPRYVRSTLPRNLTMDAGDAAKRLVCVEPALPDLVGLQLRDREELSSGEPSLIRDSGVERPQRLTL